MLTDDTGWLRMVPADGGKSLYLKWKWTAGHLKNRYVMVVGSPEDLQGLVDLLLKKKLAGEDGSGPTARDRYYSGSD